MVNTIFNDFIPQVSDVSRYMNECYQLLERIGDLIRQINIKFQNRHNFDLFSGNYNKDLFDVCSPQYGDSDIRLKIIRFARIFTEDINKNSLVDHLVNDRGMSENAVKYCSERMVLKKYIDNYGYQIDNIYTNLDGICIIRNGLDAHREGRSPGAQLRAERVLALWINNGNPITVSFIDDYPDLWRVLVEKAYSALEYLNNILLNA